MKIERSTMSILGVGVGLNELEKHNINFESKLPTITNLLQMYSQRDLSVCGKILITKTFGISKILHQLSIIDVNKSLLDVKLMNISSCFVFQEIDLYILCMCMYIISGDMYYVIVL